MRKKFLITLFWLSTLVFWSSCDACQNKSSGSSQPAAKKSEEQKNSVTIGIAQEPDTLFSPFKEMLASEEVSGVGNYSLTNFDENWHLVPWAAKEIPTKENGLLELFKENGVKKMRTTWHIREEFAWPDGVPLTADDFVFAHKIYTNPNQEILDRTVVEKIEKMESADKDKRTLIVTWKEPYAYYHNYRQHDALPKHIVEPLYNQAPEQLKKARFGQTPALAGAFSIKEWAAGSYIIAEQNPHIRGKFKPKLKEIIWRIIPQTNTLESNLISGTIDAISPTGLSLEQALLFEKRHKNEFDFYYTEGLLWEHIDFNLDNEILKDLKVRMALAYGADREGIARSLFGDRQPVAHGTEPPKSPYFNEEITKYNFDPAKAKRLLDEAGWKLEKGQSIRTKDKKALKLTLQTTSGNKTRERVEQLLQSQWRAIGIDIEIKNEPAKVFFGQTMRKRKFSGMAMYAWIKDPVKLSDTLWRCDYIPSAKNNFQGQNFSGWCNKRANDLIAQASLELDEKARVKLGKELESLIAQDLPALPMFFGVEVSVTKKGLKNWKPTGTLQPVTWNAFMWTWN
ncbi:MAG: peptide ABC transporter substrate-binding protein [Myxococcales bacterium]|nr:peptide ABC transporter substrate-binding protein [Myxococcales bacterium]USN50549.1 MAG: peptide ABC transporter substrate-binding protein [Myxococcales bacterium]